MDKFTVHPYCVATCVSGDALTALLEAGRNGTLRDEHPWLIAAELLQEANAAGARVALMVATEQPLAFAQWAWIERIDVVELRKGQWQTACDFRGLAPVNPIWTDLDSLLLKPGDDQLRREKLEPIRHYRNALDAHRLRPYAICETPGFILTIKEAGAGSEAAE